jgi:hypothetical protein
MSVTQQAVRYVLIKLSILAPNLPFSYELFGRTFVNKRILIVSLLILTIIMFKTVDLFHKLGTVVQVTYATRPYANL